MVELNHESTGYVKTISSFLDIDDYFVYEKLDNSIYLEVNLSGEVEIEFEVEQEVKREEWCHEYIIDQRTGDLESDLVHRLKTKTKIDSITKCICDCIELELVLSVNIVNRRVEKYTVKEYGLY